jgi:hypothetical protein
MQRFNPQEEKELHSKGQRAACQIIVGWWTVKMKSKLSFLNAVRFFSLSNAHRFISRLKYFPLLCQ